MSRIGMKPGEEALELVKRVSCLEGIRIEGIFTIFPGRTRRIFPARRNS